MAKVKDLLVNGSSRFIGKIYASDQFISQVANGTAPFVVSSSTLVANLNADMTDGLHVHTGRNNEVNKIVRTDANGYIQTGYINTNVGTENLAISRIFYEYNNDGYIRKMAPSSFFSVLENSGNDISITVAGQNRKLTVGYASNSDKLDGYHASDLTKFYLSPMEGGAPASSAKSWFENTMPSGAGAIVYNVPGSEKTIIVGKSTGPYGHMLQLNYDDKYLRILRYYVGNWRSDDWEKISAGYADSAGDADKLDGYHATMGSNQPWGTIPVITANGWMEVGKHFEFHYDNTTGSDYSTLLACTGNHGNEVYLPSASGTLALTTDNVASASKWATARTITLTGSVTGSVSIDGSANVTLATTTNHTHSYLPLAGGTISGRLLINSYTLPISELTTDGITSNNTWNSAQNVNLLLRSANNAMTISLGGQENERKGIIQVGHAASSYANFLGDLYLNKFGGNVYIGEDIAYHAGNANKSDVNWSCSTMSSMAIGSPYSDVFDANNPDRWINSNYGSANSDYSNMPGGWEYGTVLTIGQQNYRGINGFLNAQFVWDVQHGKDANHPGRLWWRTKNENTGWKNWQELLHTANFNSYAPKLDGTGATGTWGINISGDAATATNADKLDGFHASDFSRHITGTTLTTGTKYFKLGNLPKSSDSTWDAFLIQGEIGGWGSILKTVLNVCVSRREGVTFCGYTQGLWNRNLGIDIGVNDAGEIVLIVTGQWCAWTLDLHTIQGTISYTGTTFTPTDTNFVLLSASNNVSKSLADGTVEKATKLATPRTITLTGSVTGSVSIDGSQNVSLVTTTNHTHNYAGSSSAGGSANSALTLLYSNKFDTNYGDYAVFQQDFGRSDFPHSEWFNSIKMLHNNSKGYFTEIATSFTGEDGMWRRALRNGKQVGWYKMLDSGNYNSYALPISGGTLTGSVTMRGMDTNLVRDIVYDGTSGWARDLITLRVDGVDKFAVGAYGNYTVGASSNGIYYGYIGCNSYDGLNLRISATSLSWGDNSILHTGNYNSYAPKLDGTGATGTWGINITGSAGSATFAYVLKHNTGGIHANDRGPAPYTDALYTGGWASSSLGYATTYGTFIDLSGHSTWYHRLAFNTNGVIEHFMGINTTTLSKVGNLAYTSDIPTSLPANGGNADTVDSKHASDFAPAGHTHDERYQVISSTTASGITSLATGSYSSIHISTGSGGTMSFSSTPASGKECHIVIYNSGSSNITITLPSGYRRNIDSITIASGAFGEVNVLNAAGTIYVRAV